MKIGVPKEIKAAESRVGLVPKSVKALVEAGHEVGRPPSRCQAVRPNRRERKEQDHAPDLIGHDLIARRPGPHQAFAEAAGEP